VQIRADAAGAYALELGVVDAGVERALAPPGALHELPDLLVQSHLLE
jgi:hypothetical protein